MIGDGSDFTSKYCAGLCKEGSIMKNYDNFQVIMVLMGEIIIMRIAKDLALQVITAHIVVFTNLVYNAQECWRMKRSLVLKFQEYIAQQEVNNQRM